MEIASTLSCVTILVFWNQRGSSDWEPKDTAHLHNRQVFAINFSAIGEKKEEKMYNID